MPVLGKVTLQAQVSTMFRNEERWRRRRRGRMRRKWR